MGLFNSIRLGSSAAGDYEIERSLKFNDDDSAYLNRTPSGAGNRKTWTWSAWIKRGTLGTQQRFFTADDNATNATYFILEFQSDDNLRALAGTEAAAGTLTKETAMVFRDVSAWYHIVFKFDATNTSAVWYVNGQEITDLNSSTNPSNQDYQVNATTQHFLGRAGSSVSSGGAYFDGYLAEINFIDGSALTPSSFAETDAVTGEYKPKKYAGSYGTNGFYLNFSDNSGTTATTLGKDSSGNGNNFTPNNFSVAAGAGNDSVEDTPTNNFPTLNPLNINPYSTSGYPSPTFTNGNLTFTTNTTSQVNYAESTMYFPNSGKWYIEATVNNLNIGSSVGYAQLSVSGNTGGSRYLWWVYSSPYYQINTNSGTQTIGSISNGDIMQVAYDSDTGNVWFGKNNSWYLSGDPANGTAMSPATTVANDFARFSVSGRSGSAANIVDVNFGQRAFSYTPPTGFKALCSANLPDPTIKLPNKHFDTLLYTGNGATSPRAITGLDFAPDLVWLKNRATTYYHQLHDTVRGTSGGVLYSNSTEDEDPTYSLSSFDSNGFSIAKDANQDGQNNNGNGYVAWNWNGGGSTVTNNDGSTTSQVRANTSAGFSVLTFSIASDAVYTVGHGLGVAPKVIFMKARNQSTNWDVFHTSIGNTKRIKLNSTDAQQDYTGPWNDTDPTSTVFTSTGSWLSGSGTNVVAYCFSEVAGYSKFGSYEANNSSDGPFVYLGFEPKWIMMKPIDDSGNWQIYDNKRTPINKDDGNGLYADLNNAEASGFTIFDFLSNGFKLRNAGSGGINYTNTYIYFAFAESPFKYARAR